MKTSMLACLLITWLALASGGCCMTKRLFGWTTYWVSIRTKEETNDQGPTSVLVVWPSPDKISEFAGKTYSEVRKLIQEDLELTEGVDYIAADFGTLLPRDDVKYYKELDGNKMHRHCHGDKGLVFTTIGEGMAVRIEGSFTGYVTILLERDAVKAKFVETGHNWES